MGDPSGGIPASGVFVYSVWFFVRLFWYNVFHTTALLGHTPNKAFNTRATPAGTLQAAPINAALCFLKDMDNEEFNKVNQLDHKGRTQEAFDLLTRLAEAQHPMALLELSARYFYPENQWPPVLEIEKDIELSKQLAQKGLNQLQFLAAENDAEAMRMLAYLYFGHLCPHYKDCDMAEGWLLKAIDSGCHFASNDLASYYQFIDIEKAKYWLNYAREHNCCVVKIREQ